jgi:drug/metabolite transporter (DMT)-like permease
MGAVLAGLAYALFASLLFNVGIVLQAIDARAAPRALGYRWALLLRLLRRPVWLLGWALGIVGVVPQIAAYSNAPFLVAQPALATGLLLVLVLGVHVLGEHVRPVDVLGVCAIIGGVALVAWGAPGHTETHRSWPAVVSVVGVLSLAGAFPFAVRGRRLDTGMTAVIACGCGWAATNVATKLAGDDFDSHHLARAAIWGAVGLGNGAVATLTNMTAFQRLTATLVVPITTAIQTFLPIVVEPLFLEERWSSAAFDGGPLVAGLLLACAGSIAVASSAAVSGIFARAA